jgi:hypothetical protein
MSGKSYALMAEFAHADQLLEAAAAARALGYRSLDAYSPFPVEGLAEALGVEKERVALVTLACGLAGGLGAYFMQWYSAVVHYPIDVGGRPLHSAPAFVPVTFELTVLLAALGAVIAALAGAKLPEPYHPVFNVPAFARASQDRFFLAVAATDPLFDGEKTASFFLQAGAEAVHRVEA